MVHVFPLIQETCAGLGDGATISAKKCWSLLIQICKFFQNCADASARIFLGQDTLVIR